MFNPKGGNTLEQLPWRHSGSASLEVFKSVLEAFSKYMC